MSAAVHPIVDADTHVFETEATWSYLAESERRYRPVTLTAEPGTPGPGGRPPQFWSMGGTLHFRAPVDVDGFAGTGTIDLRDATARLADMDKLGVDVQVIFSTMFLLFIHPDPRWQLALARSYNRWAADICAASPKRLRWVACVEPRLAEESAAELRRAAAAGACGVLVRAIEDSTVLDDPRFEPIYAAANELNLPICVHTGNGWPALNGLTIGQAKKPNAVGGSAFAALAAACWMVSPWPRKYPALRIGFLETASSWVPFVLSRGRRFAERQMDRRLPDTAMRDARIYVAMEEYEDVGETLRALGEDNVIVGTDYGHHTDTSAEMLAHNLILKRTDIPQAASRKIVSANAVRFYAL